jgi:spermidine synthase
VKATKVLAEAATPDGEQLMLLTHDGQYYLKVRGLTLMSTTATQSERLMAELACDGLGQRPARVLIGGLGFGFTLRRTLECLGPDAQVDVAELLQEVVGWNREFLGEVNGALLDEPRVKILVEDVCEVIARGAGRYDALILDIDNGPDAFVQGKNKQLYDGSGFAAIKRALRPGGCAVFWSAYQDKNFMKRLGKAGFAVEEVGAKAYPTAKRMTHTLYVARRA